MHSLTWTTGRMTLTIGWSDDSFPVLTSATTDAGVDAEFDGSVPLVDILTSSHGHVPASDRLVHTQVGLSLRYESHESLREADEDVLQLRLRAEDQLMSAVLTLRAPTGVAGFSASVTVTNHDDTLPIILRSVTSWAAPFGSRRDGDGPDFGGWSMTSGRSDWLGEGRWTAEPLRSPVFPVLAQQLTGHNPRSSHAVVSTGTWSTGKHLPVGAIASADAGMAWLWQIEHNGPWRWEIGENSTDGYLAVSGPTETDHAWSVSLASGDSFTTVPTAIILAPDLPDAVDELTIYRRATRRDHPDNDGLPVVFNDYMNTLNGDPTTDRLLPLIDAAADVGAEIFCIDAGWYDDGGNWWDSVGQWLPSTVRFPGGLGEVIDRISARGMVAGLWLEPEVVGVRSPMADLLPLDAFLQRSGRRIVEHERYHLDFRHPAVIEHLDSVVDRLVTEFGVGFFKLDYNINPGAGTDVSSDSLGDGLLDHTRAHLAWLDSILDRHPTLVLENCGSGAMRMDWAMMSRLQMQSTSDQQDFVRYPPIAASAPMSILPEQAASWAYPQPEMTDEEVAFCLATGILGRFYLSGYLNNMTDGQRDTVREAVAVHRGIRSTITVSLPMWPTGLPGWDDAWVSLALREHESVLVTVWNRAAADESVILSFPFLVGREVEVSTLFPVDLPPWDLSWNEDAGELTVHNGTGSIGARVLAIAPKVGTPGVGRAE